MLLRDVIGSARCERIVYVDHVLGIGKGDIDGIKLAIAEFAEAGDREHTRLRAFGLEPFPALAAAIRAAAQFRDDAVNGQPRNCVWQPIQWS